MSMQMGQGSPIQQDSTNYAGAGLNMFNTLLAGDSRYNDIRLQQAQQQAGGLAAAGDYDAARNSMLAQGYPGQAVQYQGLANAAKTRKDEAQEADENDQAGALLAQGNHQAAAALLYKAGRFEDAQNILKHAQTSQVTGLTQQASTFAARGEWAKATEAAYRSGDLKAAGFYQDKAQEMQKSQTYQEIARTQAISKAVASAKSQEDYDRLHDSFEAAGYPKEVVAKYRNFADRDKHMLELDAHKEDLQGRLAPEEREKMATADPAGSYASRMSDPGYASTVKGVTEGRVSVSDIPAFHGRREQVIEDATVLKPDFDLEAQKNANRAWREYTSGRQNAATASGAKASLNTASEHIAGLLDNIERLPDHSLTPINAASNYLSTKGAGGAYKDFITSRDLAMGELNKVATGEAPTVEVMKGFNEKMPASGGHAALIGTAVTLADKALARLNTLEFNYKQATKGYERPLDGLNPQAIASLQRLVKAFKRTNPDLPLSENLKPFDVDGERASAGATNAPSPAPAITATPRPSGQTDGQLRAEAQRAVTMGAAPADVEAQLKAWGIQP